MITAAALAKGWLVVLALTAGQGALLAIVAYTIAKLAKPRPALEAALWLVVIGKLALPWGPAMPWSLADLLASLQDRDAAALVITAGATKAPLVSASFVANLGWLALCGVWAVGALVVIGRAVRSHALTLRSARRSPFAPATAVAELVELATRARLRVPRLVVGDATVGPHVVGVWRPTIAVPPGLLASPSLLRAALAHELAHVRRRDALARIAQVTAAALLWWCPIVPRISRRLELAREAACDASALELVEVPRGAYARLLVDMAALRAIAPAMAGRHALDARVAAVLGAPQRTGVGLVHRALLAGWVVLALGGARSAEARGVIACRYNPALAEALYLAHPEADLDGDGVLSREEACELQADMKRRAAEQTSPLDPAAEAELQSLLAEPLCCNHDRGNAYSSAEDASCHSRGD